MDDLRQAPPWQQLLPAGEHRLPTLSRAELVALQILIHPELGRRPLAEQEPTPGIIKLSPYQATAFRFLLR